MLSRARALRRDSTPAERLLWQALRRHRLHGLKFPRQVPFGRYIADFYCPTAKLVVELDGISHIDAGGDEVRDAWMRRQGIRVLRFANADVFANLDGVVMAIAEIISIPPPLAGGGQGEGSPKPQSHHV